MTKVSPTEGLTSRSKCAPVSAFSVLLVTCLIRNDLIRLHDTPDFGVAFRDGPEKRREQSGASAPPRRFRLGERLQPDLSTDRGIDDLDVQAVGLRDDDRRQHFDAVVRKTTNP
jgi:hypothetical protein